jgi:hypothetical protein
MDQRLLSPVLVMSMILLGWILAQAWFTGNGLRRRGLILVVLCSALMIVNSTRSIKMVLSYHELGRGYASARDHISETYAYLRNRPDVPVYSNAFAAIYFWTGRDTFSLPPRDGLATMKTDMQRNGALLVIFDSIPLELYNLTETEVTEGLAQEIRLSESTIYRYPEATK